jgi:hypothetical protein
MKQARAHRRPRIREKAEPVKEAEEAERAERAEQAEHEAVLTSEPHLNFDLWDRSEVYELEAFAREFAAHEARLGHLEAFRQNRENCTAALRCYWEKFDPDWQAVDPRLPLKAAIRAGKAVFTRASMEQELAAQPGALDWLCGRLQAEEPPFPTRDEIAARVRRGLEQEDGPAVAVSPLETAALDLSDAERKRVRPWPEPDYFDGRRPDHAAEAAHSSAWKKPRPDTPVGKRKPGAADLV